MVSKLSRYLMITTTVLILAGCGIGANKQPAPQQPIPPEATQPPPPPPENIVPTQPGPIIPPESVIQAVPKVRSYDWRSAMQPMVDKMLQADGVPAGSVLLVDSVNNLTNGMLDTSKATEALSGTLANNSKFTLVNAQQLASAKQQLGLSAQDSLGSRSKAIGIARKVGAQYVLYSNTSGSVTAPALKMQLMLVQSGEIVWSGNSVVQQNP